MITFLGILAIFWYGGIIALVGLVLAIIAFPIAEMLGVPHDLIATVALTIGSAGGLITALWQYRADHP